MGSTKGVVVLSPDSMNTYLSIQQDIGKMKETLGRIEGMLSMFGEQRQMAHDDHVACRKAVDVELEKLDVKYQSLERSFRTLLTWGKALSITAGFIVAGLSALNIIIAF